MERDTIGIIIGVVGAIPSYVTAFIWWNRQGRPPFGKWLRGIRQSYPFILGIFFTIVMIVLFLPPACERKPEIGITFPLDNALVRQEITVEGYADKQLCKDQHLYVVVEYGGRWWPQYSELTPGWSQATKRHEFNTPAIIGQEGDVGRRFAIRAVVGDPAVHQRFQGWFRGDSDTGFPGIPITEVTQLGRVEIPDSITVTRR